jgi:hypothetical protein
MEETISLNIDQIPDSSPESSPAGWYYKLIVWTYQHDGIPLFIYVVDYLCNVDKLNNIPYLILLLLLTAFFIILLQPLEIIIGVFQVLLGLCGLLITPFSFFFYKITGMNPIYISFLLLIRGISRITFILMLFLCVELNDRIKSEKPTTYTLKSIKEFLSDLNPYSMNWLFSISDSQNLMDSLAEIPGVGIIPGFFRLLCVVPLILSIFDCSDPKRGNIYYKTIFFLQFISGLTACLIAPINIFLYRNRTLIIPMDLRD